MDFAKILSVLWQIASEQGLVATAVFVLAGVLIWLAQGYIPILITRRGLMIGHAALTEHPFFTRIAEWRSRRIPYLPIEQPVRRRLIIDKLDIKFKIFEHHVAHTVTDKEHLKAGAEGYERFWINVILESTDEYEKQWMDIDAPVEWLEVFNEFNKQRIEKLLGRISQVAHSNFHSSYYSRDVAILDSFLMVFWDTILDAENTLEGLNGRLTGKIYKGQPLA